MKNKLFLSVIAGLFLILFMQSASAEVWVWTNTIFPNETMVRYHAYYQIEDTSFTNILIQKPVRVQLIGNVQDLPYNISQYYPQYPNAYVDWCNYTITWQKNEYDSTLGLTDWKIINTSLITTSTLFQNTNATFQIDTYTLRARDGLIADMDCHYTNPDTLFIDNNYFGFISAIIPAFECKGCGDYTFEEVTNLNEQIEANNFQEKGFADKIQQVIEKNFQVWIILFWFIKIALVGVAVILIFLPMYYFYMLIKSIQENIR